MQIYQNVRSQEDIHTELVLIGLNYPLEGRILIMHKLFKKNLVTLELPSWKT